MSVIDNSGTPKAIATSDTVGPTPVTILMPARSTSTRCARLTSAGVFGDEGVRSSATRCAEQTSVKAVYPLALVTPVKPTLANWGSVPRAFIRCTADKAIPIITQDSMIADADASTPSNKFQQVTLALSHSPFLSMPKVLVDALVGLATLRTLGFHVVSWCL
jgi:hypothetical protein